MTLVIRPARPSDSGAIAGLHSLSWQQSYRGVLPDAYLDGALPDDMGAKWDKRLTRSRPGWLILVADEDERFAGFFAAGPDADDPARDLIDNLHVRPGLRGHGIGAALMREGADRLAAIGRRRAFLRVVESNARARAFYVDLGGTEAEIVRQEIAPGYSVELVPYHWDRVQDIATAARRRLARKMRPPLSVTARDAPAVTAEASGADHPVEAAARVRPRRKQKLGDLFGIAGYGVNRVELDPGVWSSIPHWHSHEDEFVYVLEGELTLISGAEEQVLRAGDCAGFPAGLDRPHHLRNRGPAPAVYLEIGSRLPDRDEVDYPGEDLRVVQREDGRRTYARRDGRRLGDG